jgi:hypothetical protein
MLVNQPQKISIALSKPTEESNQVTTKPVQKPRKPRPKKPKKPKVELVTTDQANSDQGTSVTTPTDRMISTNFNFIPQKPQILPVISEISASTPVNTITSTAGDSEMSVENPHELIKKLLNANKVTLNVQKQSNVPNSPQTENRPVTSVTEQELKSIGISLKHQESSHSPGKSDDSSVKSGSSTQPSTPTSVPQSDPMEKTATGTQPVPLQTFQKTALITPPEIKQEPGLAEKNPVDMKPDLNKDKNRKRRKSVDSKAGIKKRKRGDTELSNSNLPLVPLSLAEAPIR